MNILVIGNGFDLAHDLPTSYSDVLNFLYAIKSTSAWHGGKNKFIDVRLRGKNISKAIYDYSMDAFDSRIENTNGNCKNSNPIIQEIYDNLDDNIWYIYLWSIYSQGKMRGINWIDFESEISFIIEQIDREEQNLYLPFKKPTQNKDEKSNIFFSLLLSNNYLLSKDKPEGYQPTFRDFLDKSYKDLRRLVRCIEIYLTEYVEKIPITKVSPDIKGIDVHAVLNFNYTHTYANNYLSDPKIPIHHIHGEVRNSMTAKNNMVLGIDEYHKGKKRDTDTNYNIYKKFTQRIINETGFLYRDWIKNIDDDYKRFKEQITPGHMDLSEIFIFGHSLDVTDKDVLKDLIYRPNVRTTIYYHDKQQQAQQIANLVKLLKQKKFIKMVNCVPPRISFVPQQPM